MEKAKKWMILGMVATLFCLVVAIVCAVLRKFDVVTSVMLGFIVLFSAFITFFMWRDLAAESKQQKELVEEPAVKSENQAEAVAEDAAQQSAEE